MKMKMKPKTSESENESEQEKQMANNGRLTMTIAEFARAIGCSKNLVYLLARQDKLPVPVIRIGSKRMCVSKRAVERLLSTNENSA